MTVIDAHHHVWNLARSAYPWLQAPLWDGIRRDWDYTDLIPALDACGVARSILVQADNSAGDTAHMRALARREARVAGYVGWVPLADTRAASAALEELADDPQFVGIRHVLTLEEDDDWILRPAVLASLGVLERLGKVLEITCDRIAHPAHVPFLAKRFPDLTIVVNHIAKPPIASRGWEPWAGVLAAAAAAPRVYSKLSGLTTPYRPEWQGEDFRPYIEHALRVFGPERLMYASNWPVTLVAGSYRRNWDALAQNLAGLSEAERAAVYGGTATRCYQLAAPAGSL